VGGIDGKSSFPTLPTEVVNGIPGFHARTVNLVSHNLFEEYPCLGLAIEAAQAYTQQNNVYVSVLSTNLNANALGFMNMVGPFRNASLQMMHSCGFGGPFQSILGLADNLARRAPNSTYAHLTFY